jgi:hypothetical protein
MTDHDAYAPGRIYTVDDGLALDLNVKITPELLRSEAARLDATPAAGAGSVLLGQMASLLRRTAAHLDVLAVELDDAQLRSIEARNPGIDIDEVRRYRTAQDSQETR